METKTLTAEMIEKLKAPLPAEAIKQHPTKKFLSTIKVIYVVERLNEVFGLGKWFVRNEIVEAKEYVNPETGDPKPSMIIVKSTLTVPEYGIEIEQFGGNDNADRGDAYKGACTDALSKIGSYLYIGMDVYKGLSEKDITPKCEMCKRTITAYTKPDSGEVAPLGRVLEAGRKQWKKDLCGGCQIQLTREAKSKQPETAKPVQREEVPLKDPEVIHADSGECFVQGTVTEVFRQAANKPLVIKLDTVALSCWHKSLIEPLKLSKGAKIDVVCSVKGDFKNIEKVNRIGNIEFSDNVPVIHRDSEESLYA